jgi:hypothetical protein
MPKLIKESDLAAIFDNGELSDTMQWQLDDGTPCEAGVILRYPEQLVMLGVQEIHDAKRYALIDTASTRHLTPKSTTHTGTLVTINDEEFRVLAITSNHFGMSRVMLGTAGENVSGDYYAWQ